MSLPARALAHAPQALSIEDCLSLLIGQKPHASPRARAVARRLLEQLGEDEALRTLEEQAEIGNYALPHVAGLSDGARHRVLAAFALARRLQGAREARRLRKPVDASQIFSLSLRCVPHDCRLESREWIGFVALSHEGAWSPLQIVARGVRNHVNLAPADLFRPLLSQRARGFCLYHNHPSGSCLPSPTDLELTELVLDLSLPLGVLFLGHGIVGPGSEHWIDGRTFLEDRAKTRN